MNENKQTQPIINQLNIRTMQKDLGGRTAVPEKKVQLSGKAPLSGEAPPPAKLPVVPATPMPSKPPTPPPIAPKPFEKKPTPPMPPVPPQPSIYSKPPSPPPSPPRREAGPPKPPMPPKPTVPTVPATPKKPVLPKAPSPLPKLPKRKPSPRFWLYLSLGIAALLLIATLGFLFYQEEAPPEPPPIVEPPIIEPLPDILIATPTLIPQISTTTIALIEKNETELKNKVLETAEKITEEQNIIRILPTLTEDGVKSFLTLSELTTILGLNIPMSLKESSEETYNLLLSCQEQENRLLLVLETANPDEASKTMTEWEETMLEDLKGLLLVPAGAAETPEFQEVVYNQANFRYKNLPISSVTINYTLYQNLIIIGTSKNSIYTVYDLVSQSSSIQ